MSLPGRVMAAASAVGTPTARITTRPARTAPTPPPPARSVRRPRGSQRYCPNSDRAEDGDQRGRYADREDHNASTANMTKDTWRPARSVRRPRGSQHECHGGPVVPEAASAVGAPTARITTRRRGPDGRRRRGQRGRYADREDHNKKEGREEWLDFSPARSVRRPRGSQHGGAVVDRAGQASAVGTPTARITTPRAHRGSAISTPPARSVRRPRGSQLRVKASASTTASAPARSVRRPRGSQLHEERLPGGDRFDQRGRYADREDHNTLVRLARSAAARQRGRYADREDHNDEIGSQQAATAQASAVGTPTARITTCTRRAGCRPCPPSAVGTPTARITTT